MSYYKRNLPHYQPKGYYYFITTRLKGSLPKGIVSKIKSQYDAEIKEIPENISKKNAVDIYNNIKKNYFYKYEEILDSAKQGNTWLKNKNIADVVKNTLQFYNGKKYNLICFTIMPNHIHLIIYPIVERNSVSLKNNNGSKIYNYKKSESGDSLYIVTKIMQNIKKYSAREANKILKRTGQFWQNESYDHVIRNKEELYNTVNYILNNPVKAGLTKSSFEWEWNYVDNKYLI